MIVGLAWWPRALPQVLIEHIECPGASLRAKQKTLCGRDLHYRPTIRYSHSSSSAVDMKALRVPETHAGEVQICA